MSLSCYKYFIVRRTVNSAAAHAYIRHGDWRVIPQISVLLTPNLDPYLSRRWRQPLV